MTSSLMQPRNGLMSVAMPDGSLIYMADNDPLRASYGVYIPGVVPAATPTDLLVIKGSATKLIRVRSIILTGTATSASNIQFTLQRRNAANTGGTSTAPAINQRDTNDDAPTAVLALYSANPTGLGTAVGGPLDGGRLNLAPAANGGIDRLALQYSWLNDKAPVLRGVNDYLCINLGGQAWPAGGQVDISLTLSEE